MAGCIQGTSDSWMRRDISRSWGGGGSLSSVPVLAYFPRRLNIFSATIRPSSVAVHLEAPHGSARNVLPVTIAGLDIHGTTVRIRGTEQPDGGTGLAADITAASAADLDLQPGQTVQFAIKTQEVELHSALAGHS